MTADLEDRLEELFTKDANARRVSSVSAPRRRAAWRGVLTFAAAAAALGIAAIAAIALLRGGQQVAAPPASSTPFATPTITASPAPTATMGPTATAPAVATGTVAGRIAHGGDTGYPALSLYALPVNNTADGRHVIHFPRSFGRFELIPDQYAMTLPPGTYYFIAYSHLEPGDMFPAAGAYTAFAACGAQRSCGPHDLLPVTVTAGQTLASVDITDWFLDLGRGYPPEPRS